jgi:hypothetical protein
MNHSPSIPEVLRTILVHPRNGVVGLVDDLLQACRQHRLQIDWRLNHFQMRSAHTDWEELTELAVGKSAFRAVLARISAICSQHNPHSISPYGGKCELLSDAGDRTLVEVRFENTPSEQKLELVTKLLVEKAPTSKPRNRKR